VFVGGLIWSLILLPPLVELLHIHVLIALAIAVVLMPLCQLPGEQAVGLPPPWPTRGATADQ
jgi:hypothetical protein